MSERCEPPEELRGVDGWHWVQPPVGNPHLARWHVAEHDGVEPLWTSTHHVYSGTPRYAVREWGWRYVAPVTPPAAVTALVEALEGLERMAVAAYRAMSPAGNIGEENAFADNEPAIKAARAALALYRGEAGR